MVIRHRAGSDEHTDQAAVTQSSPFYPFSPLFSYVGSSPVHLDPSLSLHLILPLNTP